MCPGVGVQTRRQVQVNQSILRTYSVEPHVVGNTFLPVAPRYSDDSDLEGQAEDRRISRAQGAADEQQRYAQEQGRRDEERQKRAMILQGGEGQLSGSRLGRIEEDDEEKNDEQEDASRDGENDDEEEAEGNQAGDEYADGVQQVAVGNDKFKFADLPQQDEESPHHSYNNGLANNALEYSKTDEIEVVENVSRQIRAISISSSVDDQTSRASLQARPVKDDRYIIPALNVMVSLSLAERVQIFRAAFPKLRDHEVSSIPTPRSGTFGSLTVTNQRFSTWTTRSSPSIRQCPLLTFHAFACFTGVGLRRQMSHFGQDYANAPYSMY